jgi:hypothetical protein
MKDIRLKDDGLTQSFEECIQAYFPELESRERSIEYELVDSGFGITTPVTPFQENAAMHSVLHIPRGYEPGNPVFKVLICWELCRFVDPFHPLNVYKEKMPVNMIGMWQAMFSLGFIEFH